MNEPMTMTGPYTESILKERDSRRAAPACSAAKHAAMYRDGWKNCWHCGAELVSSLDGPNTALCVKPDKGANNNDN